MPRSVEIWFAGDPVAKGRPRLTTISGQARAFTPAKTRKYEANLCVAASEQMRGQPLLEGPLSLSVSVYLPVPRSWSGKQTRLALAGERRPVSRPDIDNYVKTIGDALNSVVWKDDSQIVSMMARKLYSEKPGIQIQVTEIRRETDGGKVDAAGGSSIGPVG